MSALRTMTGSKSGMNVLAALAAVTALLPGMLLAQTACHEPVAADFKTTVLVDVHSGMEESSIGSWGPVQMAIAPDGRIFVAEMKSGDIRLFTPTATLPTKMTTIGNIPTWMSTEDGLLGIALDPKFADNHWLYAFYSDPCGKSCPNRAMELGRYTVTNNALTNKKVILRYPRATDDDHHASGGLAFDDNGVLIIGSGDNTDPHDATNNGYGPINFGRAAADAARTSGNTNDLRGKLLRIKPKAFSDTANPAPGVGATYDIPAGNLWEVINNKTFNPNWDASENINLVRKEIFSFGHRNPYHPRVDTKSGWIFWGEVGPDANTDDPARGPSGHDEWNLATAPGFFGHPFCNGYNVPYNMMTNASPATYGGKFNCADIVNNSPNNTGLKHLPPAIPAVAAYTSGNSTDDDPRFNAGTTWTSIQHAGETAIGGPMYRYNPDLKSTTKFPPFYEGKIFFFDWVRRNFRILTMNPNGTLPAGTAGVKNFPATDIPVGSYIDMQFGPDGAMYLIKFSDAGYSIGAGPQLVRVDYIGPQDAACYKPFVATVGPVALQPKPVKHQRIAQVTSNGIFNLPTGYRGFTLFDASGREAWSFHRESAAEDLSVRLPARFGRGIWQTKVSP